MSDVTQFLSKGLDSLSLKDVEGVTPRLSETLIASHLNRLSVKDRDLVLQDIHGVAELIDENPIFVQQSLGRLQDELGVLIAQHQNKNPHKVCALELAMQQDMNTSLLGLPNHQRPQCSLFRANFRLSFLRAEQFDAKKAAERIFNHFEEKLDLFGPEKLTRDILIQDLDEETTECLECGRMQLLPQRDRCVRPKGIFEFGCPCDSSDVLTSFIIEFLFPMAALEERYWWAFASCTESFETSKAW
jgi:hypothetical protein